MSTNGNVWKPKEPETIHCPSGQVVKWSRPGPEFTLKSGRVARTFSAVLARTKINLQDAGSLDQAGIEIMAQMSDEELANVMLYAKQLLLTIDSPKLVLNPRPGFDEIGPADIPNGDFWFLFGYAMKNFIGIKVPVADTEVEVSDLETFRAESGIQGDGMDSTHVQSDSELHVGDQGLVNSAGV